MARPLISIVIPFKNTQDFIGECIDSIIGQTHQNWEAIFIDDHAEDHSFKIVKRYAEENTRLKVYKNKSTGIIEALKTAFSYCSGDYITRMDSDDIMMPNRLEVMLKSLEDHGKKHLAVGQVKYFIPGMK